MEPLQPLETLQPTKRGGFLMITTQQLDKLRVLGEKLQIEFADLPASEKASLTGENLIGQITGLRKAMEILT